MSRTRGGSTWEVPLVGGTTNRGLVTRVGDTVRRPVRPTSAATWAVLRHLEQVGFPGAPRFLGVDEAGREVLSFIEGAAVTPPYPAWALTDEALVSVARLLRAYHEAVEGFDPAGLTWGRAVPQRFLGGLITHNDPNLDNVVFRDGRAVALIDFDLAAPGSAVWDVACAARLWSPLRDERDVPGPIAGSTLQRLRGFVDAYELPRGDRERFVGAAMSAHAWCYRIVADAVGAGHPSFTPYWVGGGADQAVRTRTAIFRARRQIREALL